MAEVDVVSHDCLRFLKMPLRLEIDRRALLSRAEVVDVIVNQKNERFDRTSGDESWTKRCAIVERGLPSGILFVESGAGVQQIGPVFSRISLIEHCLENGVGVGLRTIGSQGFAVIDPSVDDNPRGR